MTADRRPRYEDITDEERGWLEEAREPDDVGPRVKCCASCQAGPIPRQFPCARRLACVCHDRAR